MLRRVHERHPELTSEDVVTAFRSIEADVQRANGAWAAIGLDGRGRDVELVYRMDAERVLIYHALTLPTKKIIREIHSMRRTR